MSAALSLLKVASRRMTAAGWRGYALAAAVLIAAVTSLSAFAGPSPATDQLAFSVSGSSSRNPTVLIGSGGAGELMDSVFSTDKSHGSVMNYSSEELKAPPLDLGNSTSDELAAPPLDPEVTSPLSPTENFRRVRWNLCGKLVCFIYVRKRNKYCQEITLVPAGSTTINPPPFLVTPSSMGKPSTNEGPISLMETEWQLIDAKKEIGRSPVISVDPDLYASLFQNVSVFKREKALKKYGSFGRPSPSQRNNQFSHESRTEPEHHQSSVQC